MAAHNCSNPICHMPDVFQQHWQCQRLFALPGTTGRNSAPSSQQTKDGKPVPLPISMIRSTPNSGTPIRVLEQAVTDATAAVNAVLAAPEWTAALGASKDMERTQSQRVKCVERLVMLKEERSRIRKLIREEEDRLRLIDNELHGKKRKYSDVVVPEEMRAE